MTDFVSIMGIWPRPTNNQRINGRGVQSREPGRPGDWTLYGSAQYLWVLSMELATYLPSGAYKSEVATRFL